MIPAAWEPRVLVNSFINRPHPLWPLFLLFTTSFVTSMDAIFPFGPVSYSAEPISAAHPGSASVGVGQTESPGLLYVVPTFVDPRVPEGISVDNGPPFHYDHEFPEFAYFPRSVPVDSPFHSGRAQITPGLNRVFLGETVAQTMRLDLKAVRGLLSKLMPLHPLLGSFQEFLSKYAADLSVFDLIDKFGKEGIEFSDGGMAKLATIRTIYFRTLAAIARCFGILAAVADTSTAEPLEEARGMAATSVFPHAAAWATHPLSVEFFKEHTRGCVLTSESVMSPGANLLLASRATVIVKALRSAHTVEAYVNVPFYLGEIREDRPGISEASRQRLAYARPPHPTSSATAIRYEVPGFAPTPPGLPPQLSLMNRLSAAPSAYPASPALVASKAWGKQRERDEDSDWGAPSPGSGRNQELPVSSSSSAQGGWPDAGAWVEGTEPVTTAVEKGRAGPSKADRTKSEALERERRLKAKLMAQKSRPSANDQMDVDDWSGISEGGSPEAVIVEPVKPVKVIEIIDVDALPDEPPAPTSSFVRSPANLPATVSSLPHRPAAPATASNLRAASRGRSMRSAQRHLSPADQSRRASAPPDPLAATRARSNSPRVPMRDSLAYRPFERLPPVIFADLISRMDYAVMPDGPEMDRWREVLLRQVSRRVPEGPRTLPRWLDDAIGP